MVTWEQRVLAGDPMFPGVAAHSGLPGRALRGAGRAARDQSRATRTTSSSAWNEALAAGRPAVLEAVVDGEIPPLPPHITGSR